MKKFPAFLLGLLVALAGVVAPLRGQLTAQDYLERADAKDKQGDSAGALAELGRAIALDPVDQRAYNNRGSILAALGKFDDALRDLDHAIALAPNYAHAYYNRGETKLSMGNLAGAMADFNRAVELSPQDYYGFYGRGRARLTMGNNGGAIADLNRALVLNPRSGAAFSNRAVARDAMGDHAGAQADYRQAAALGETPGEALVNLGNAKSAARNYSGALADYNRAIALDPQEVTAVYNRGLGEIKQGNSAAAIEDFSRVIASNPRDDGAYYHRGLAQSMMGNLADALKDYDRTFALNPKFELLYSARGHVRRVLGDFSGALADYNHALQLNRTDDRAWIGRIKTRLGQRDFAGALKDLDQVAAAHPGDYTVFEKRADVKNLLGDFDGALADYDRTLAIYWAGGKDGKLVYPLFLGFRSSTPLDLELKKTAVQLWGQGDHVTALASLDRLLKQGPNAQATGYRAVARWRNGDLAGAGADFTLLLGNNSASPQLRHDRGLVLEAQGNFPAAFSDYVQAIAGWKSPEGHHSMEELDGRAARQYDVYGFTRAFSSPGYLPSHLVSPDEENRTSLHLALVMARQGRGDPMAALGKQAAQWPEGPAREIARFLTGALPESGFVGASTPTAGAPNRSDAFYYAGMKHLLANEPRQAAEFFKQSVAAGHAASPEYQLARAELARLGASE